MHDSEADSGNGSQNVDNIFGAILISKTGLTRDGMSLTDDEIDTASDTIFVLYTMAILICLKKNRYQKSP